MSYGLKDINDGMQAMGYKLPKVSHSKFKTKNSKFLT